MILIGFPVFVLETETGDLTVINDDTSLKGMIEEFIDILAIDFKFWDKDGYRLTFDESFLTNGTGSVQRSEQAFESEVRSHLLAYAERKGVKVTDPNNRPLEDIFAIVEGRIKH